MEKGITDIELMNILLEYMSLNERGGELFKRGF